MLAIYIEKSTQFVEWYINKQFIFHLYIFVSSTVASKQMCDLITRIY